MTHTLTIYFDGDEMAPVFKCNAKPSASGQPPACWTYLDDENDLHVTDHCNAKEWIEAEDPTFAKREISLDVEVDWDDDAPQVVVSDPAKRIAELETELAKFKPCDGECLPYHDCGCWSDHHKEQVYHKENNHE